MECLNCHQKTDMVHARADGSFICDPAPAIAEDECEVCEGFGTQPVDECGYNNKQVACAACDGTGIKEEYR